MNYKVMQRPMFKLGGKAASQGTGITSGLDEKVNYSIGGGVIQGQNMNGREGFEDPRYNSNYFLKSAMDKISKRDAAMDGMDNLINMQALQQASNVLAGETSNNPLDILVNFAKQGTSIALPALSARKKLELKQLDPSTDLALAKAFKKDSTGSQKVYELKKADLERINSELYDENVLLQKAKEAGDEKAIAELTRNIALLQESKNLVFSTFQTDEELRSELITKAAISGYPITDKEIDKIIARIRGGNAMGGTPNRVDRQMGSPMMGEQPMAQAPQMMAPQQDVAMETQQGGGQNSGNQVYAMLRSRLPQEVSDEVVQLISFNKEAFADFASIKNQEDVSSFNDKYGVQLVIDVATD
jgi:hypothetical protein